MIYVSIDRFFFSFHLPQEYYVHNAYSSTYKYRAPNTPMFRMCNFLLFIMTLQYLSSTLSSSIQKFITTAQRNDYLTICCNYFLVHTCRINEHFDNELDGAL